MAVHFVSDSDAAALKEWRRQQKMIPKNQGTTENRRIPQVIGSGGSRMYYGKPKTAFTAAGPLSEPDNVVILWKGMKEGALSEDTGNELEVHWTTGAFGTTDLIVVTEFSDGGRAVSCFPGSA